MLFSLCWVLIFPTKFTFFWIFLDLLVSVNIHVIKIITSNLADVWYIFSLILLTFLYCIAYKSIFKLNICAQPMHQIFVINHCIFLKTSLSEYEWVTRHKYGFHDDGFKVWKKSMPTKILSSFTLTAQPHQNIGNSSN